MRMTRARHIGTFFVLFLGSFESVFFFVLFCLFLCVFVPVFTTVELRKLQFTSHGSPPNTHRQAHVYDLAHFFFNHCAYP